MREGLKLAIAERKKQPFVDVPLKPLQEALERAMKEVKPNQYGLRIQGKKVIFGNGIVIGGF